MRYMEWSGWILALALAAVLAVGGLYLLERRVRLGRAIYLGMLAFLGLFAGSELFGAIGDWRPVSEHGPQVGGFYVLTGLVGGVLLVGAALLTLRRAQVGASTDVASAGIRDPQVAHLLFGDTRSAPLWLGIRLFIGYEWLAAGWEKVTGTGWLDGGAALQRYWTNAVAVPSTGRPAITYGWYRDFLQYMLDHQWYTWFAKLVAVGEGLVGLALLVGVVVGIAAFFGALMNFNFMLAGSASTNPVLFGLAVALILAWKVAGYWGLDRVVLPLLGAPWSPGAAFRAAREPQAPTPA